MLNCDWRKAVNVEDMIGEEHSTCLWADAAFIRPQGFDVQSVALQETEALS